MRLTEVEAYDGANDPGSHAHNGRTEPQRGDVRPARAPLRLLHLRHAPLLQRLLRTRRASASAILLRAGEVVDGLETRPGASSAAPPTATWPAVPAGCARRWASTASDNGLDLRQSVHLGPTPAEVSTGPRVGLRTGRRPPLAVLDHRRPHREPLRRREGDASAQ